MTFDRENYIDNLVCLLSSRLLDIDNDAERLQYWFSTVQEMEAPLFLHEVVITHADFP